MTTTHRAKGWERTGLLCTLALADGRDRPVQLPPDALLPQGAEGEQSLHTGLRLLIGAELRGGLCHIHFPTPQGWKIRHLSPQEEHKRELGKNMGKKINAEGLDEMKKIV